jgi:hypothetical protein
LPKLTIGRDAGVESLFSAFNFSSQFLNPRDMAPFLKQYFKALGGVTGLMLFYWLTINVWIQPEGAVQYAIPSFSGISSPKWWEPIFSGDDWEVQQPTVVHNSRGVLLAKTWEQVDQRTWKLTPLTIVLTQVDAEELGESVDRRSQHVWVIRARQGATIHFDQPLDLNSGSVPSIQRGQLEGGINISKVTLDSPRQSSFQLQTSNLAIDRRQIWTEDEVKMSSPDLNVTGRVLRISLSSDILSRKESRDLDESQSGNGPVEEIELLHLSTMEMQLQPGGLWAGLDPRTHQLDQPISDLPAFVRAECGGRFRLNLRRQMATLTNGVHLWHHVGALPPDEFHCHRVQIQFQPAAFQAQSKPHSTAESDLPAELASFEKDTPELLGGLQLREIEAFGIDSLQELVGEMWVELKSPLLNASARAKRIRVDVTKPRIELAGKLNHPDATVSVAELNYQGHHLRAPLLEYQPPPRDNNGDSVHAGWMVAQGAGEMSSSPSTGIGEFQVRWQEHFRFAPLPDESGQWIEVAGNTFVESKQWGYIAAERLQLWVDTAESTSIKPAPANIRLKRLIADGSTRIRAGQAQLAVSSLDITFLHPPVGAQQAESGLKLQNSSGAGMFQFLSQPGSPSQEVSPSGSGLPTESQPVDIFGQALKATVISSGGQSWVDSLTLEGPLSMKAIRADAQPIEMVGRNLVMATTPNGEMDLEVQGEPAQIRMGDGSIQGPSFRFNQRENRIWMDHPGECVFPAKSLDSTANPNSNRWALPLRCSWKGRMMFDGGLIRCDGGVRISGAMQQSENLWIMESFCDSLEFQLVDHIDFGRPVSKSGDGIDRLPPPLTQSASSDFGTPQPGSFGTPPPRLAEVSTISLNDGVDIRVAQRDSSGRRISLQRLQVPIATIHVAQQKIIAKGPGQGLSKFVDSRRPSSSATQGPATGPSTGPATVQPQLQCAHLLFRDNLVALLDRNEIVVEGNVRVVSSPISGWGENFDPTGLNGLALGQISMACDQLKLIDTRSLSTTPALNDAASDLMESSGNWEIQATGNVVFEGSAESGDYAGNAYQMTYVQSKDVLTIRGDGRSKALLQRTPNTQSDSNFPTVIQVPIAMLNLKTMGVEVPQGGLDVSVDFQQTPSLVPSGSPDSGQATTPPGTPNPRDGIKNFLRGY